MNRPSVAVGLPAIPPIRLYMIVLLRLAEEYTARVNAAENDDPAV